MVLELKSPPGADWQALRSVVPPILNYVLSFVFLGIYWNNHHHMFHVVHQVNGRILWANLHLLFWLSLVPFITTWMSENHFTPLPTAVYGGVLLLSAFAYRLLQSAIIAQQGGTSRLRAAVGRDAKGIISSLLYALAIPLAFVHPLIADALYVTVALIWLVPDTRIEARMRE
jgi:uncharacterized membrane protein